MSTPDRTLGLQWNGRTYLRILLVIAGIAFLVRGAQTGEAIDLVLGILGILVGSIGLTLERRD